MDFLTFPNIYFYFSRIESLKRPATAPRAFCPRSAPAVIAARSRPSPRTTPPNPFTWPASSPTRPAWLTLSVRSTDPAPRSTRKRSSRRSPSWRPRRLCASVLWVTLRRRAAYARSRPSGWSILARSARGDSTRTGKTPPPPSWCSPRTDKGGQNSLFSRSSDFYLWKLLSEREFCIPTLPHHGPLGSWAGVLGASRISWS